ncbi:MAG: ABC transporter ATP-binding protein [Candidatus Portnoybacteria bacterium]|nr:ABC transporter ATP-binding protein [Candidatus Portnoybacteria bacterium]MDD5589787.1 ABC transporter ATP-binding protein [Candidatus Portnoybacteria bacterium]
MEPEILKVNNLIKKYGPIRAVDGVSFFIRPGETLGLLGPNGAGKTTTINMILGILEPTGGSIEILGQDIKQNREKVSRQMNFAAVYAQLPGNLTVYQNLHTFGLLYGVKNLREKIEASLKEFDLEKFAKTKAGLLSSGEASRLSLAKALLNDPALLLLDEPTSSLDPSIAQNIREKIKEKADTTKVAILWTSHNMHEIEMVCDRVLFLSHGKILLSGDPKTLPAEHGKKDLEELFIDLAREKLTFE